MGGDTYVMDLVGGAKFLKYKRPEIYERLKELVGLLNLQEINDFKLYNGKNVLGIPTTTHHQLITPSKDLEGEEVLFLSVHALLNSQTFELATDLNIKQIHDILET